MPTAAERARQEYLEEYGQYAETVGLPRMAGKILGWLMICAPPPQTAAELAAALGASTGTISTMTRLLIQMGVIEKVGIPGRRRAHYRIKPDVWSQILDSELAQMRRMRALAERGLALLQGTPPENQQRLREMREMFAFAEREWPAMLARFRGQRKSPR